MAAPIQPSEYERGTATILRFTRRLCKFARKYDYIRLMGAATGSPEMGLAIGALIAACDVFQSLDNTPGETSPWEVE